MIEERTMAWSRKDLWLGQGKAYGKAEERIMARLKEDFERGGKTLSIAGGRF